MKGNTKYCAAFMAIMLIAISGCSKGNVEPKTNIAPCPKGYTMKGKPPMCIADRQLANHLMSTAYIDNKGLLHLPIIFQCDNWDDCLRFSKGEGQSTEIFSPSHEKDKKNKK